MRPAGAIVACEALLRWRHPLNGSMAPCEFIPVAEEMGLIVPLGRLDSAPRLRRRRELASQIGFAINLSAIQFGNRSLVPAIVQALGATSLDPRRVSVEITEGVLLRNAETTVAALYQLRSLGIHVARDDFGTAIRRSATSAQLPVRLDQDRCAFVAGRADNDEDASYRACDFRPGPQPADDDPRRKALRPKASIGPVCASLAAQKCWAICSARRCPWPRLSALSLRISVAITPPRNSRAFPPASSSFKSVNTGRLRGRQRVIFRPPAGSNPGPPKASESH